MIIILLIFKLCLIFRIDIPNYDRPICNCCTHIAYSRTRIGQLNDKERNNKYIEALSKKIKPNTTCLCFSDGCFLGLAAAQLGAKKVYMLETNFLSQKTIEMFIETNNLGDKVEIISTDKLPPASMVDLIFGEPYFISSIVPWENLRFWYLASQYSSQVQKIPIAATIKAVAVEFKDLHKIRAPLGMCEGFDLSSFDKLVQVRHSSVQVVQVQNILLIFMQFYRNPVTKVIVL